MGARPRYLPGSLRSCCQALPLPVDPKILVDIATHDDAGVYKISDDLALVFTTDFFPPLVSDGYEFGLIAATNSISDVYAMGGTPLLALNIMMFPSSRIPLEVYSDILRGGYDKAKEAGVSIIGGHSIDDYPPKYGLAVIGTVHPDKIITNAGAREGDLLILTKPLGTGIILAGHRMKMTTGDQLEAAKTADDEAEQRRCAADAEVWCHGRDRHHRLRSRRSCAEDGAGIRCYNPFKHEQCAASGRYVHTGGAGMHPGCRLPQPGLYGERNAV